VRKKGRRGSEIKMAEKSVMKKMGMKSSILACAANIDSERMKKD
jgi:hypothetical protein